MKKSEIKTKANKSSFALHLPDIYRRHGFIVAEKEGCLLISFKEAEKVNIITRYEEATNPLTFDQVKIFYEQLYKLGKKYNCHQYRLICPSGFEPNTDFFDNVNLALSSKNYLKSLQSINHIELYAHNDIAYVNLCKMLQDNKRACVIQPTGTGKSLILSKFITDNPLSKFVVLTPGVFIINEIKKHLLNTDNIEFFTYTKVTFLTVKEVKDLKPDYIIVDEFHRCGAEEWGAGVQLLLSTYPQAKLIGTTATHIRYLDDKRNMADELFEGNIAHHLTLSKAIALGILPTPKYISALYKFDEEYLRVKKSVADSMAEDKKVILERLNKIKLEFENTSSIPQILQEHLTGEINKIIVFTKDIKHLRKHKDMVLSWFNSIGYDNIQSFEVHSENEAKNKVVFKSFEQSIFEGLKIMFSVNMLNEGVHVKGVNCEIMLRDTESPIIYYQQFGRCLTVEANEPLIFDLVNNFANIRHRNIENDVKNEFQKLSELFKTKGIPYDEVNFEIIDMIRDIKDLLDEVEQIADPWNIFIEKLVLFKNKYGHLNIQSNYTDQWLVNKIGNIRIDYKNNTLEQWKINILNELGFIWNVHNYYWQLLLSQLNKFYQKNGHANIPPDYEDKKLYKKYLYVMRCKNKFPQWVNEELKKIGIIYIPKEISNADIWDKYYNEYILFVKQNNTTIVPRTISNLYGWWLKQIREFKNNNLSPEKLDKLKSINFNFNSINKSKDEIWDIRFNELKEYYLINGHFKIKTNELLTMWISNQKKAFLKKYLSEDKIIKLNSINFFASLDLRSWDEKYEEIKIFYNLNGHHNCRNTNKETFYWLCQIKQKLNSSKNNLTIDQINKLKLIGIEKK